MYFFEFLGNMLAAWAVGINGICLSDNVGIRIGKHGAQVAIMRVNNYVFKLHSKFCCKTYLCTKKILYQAKSYSYKTCINIMNYEERGLHTR